MYHVTLYIINNFTDVQIIGKLMKCHKLLMNITESKGPSTDPSDRPLLIGFQTGEYPSTITLCVLQ